jgi:hypothetical protein
VRHPVTNSRLKISASFLVPSSLSYGAVAGRWERVGEGAVYVAGERVVLVIAAAGFGDGWIWY